MSSALKNIEDLNDCPEEGSLHGLDMITFLISPDGPSRNMPAPWLRYTLTLPEDAPQCCVHKDVPPLFQELIWVNNLSMVDNQNLSYWLLSEMKSECMAPTVIFKLCSAQSEVHSETTFVWGQESAALSHYNHFRLCNILESVLWVKGVWKTWLPACSRTFKWTQLSQIWEEMLAHVLEFLHATSCFSIH